MNVSLELKTGRWSLLVGPHGLNPGLLEIIAHLAERSGLRILDGGNRFNAYTVARAARGNPDVLDRITVSRAFTCYQVLSLLESTPALHLPFVVLDMLNTFYDESVRLRERRHILTACLAHLERLSQAAAGVVSAHPSKVPTLETVALFDHLQASAGEVYTLQPAETPPPPLRLF